MFKFDSELAKDEMEEDEEEEKGENDEEDDANKKMSVSLDDLNDALNDDVGGAATTTTDNDSESDFKECSSGAYGEELRYQHNPMLCWAMPSHQSYLFFLPNLIPTYWHPSEICDK